MFLRCLILGCHLSPSLTHTSELHRWKMIFFIMIPPSHVSLLHLFFLSLLSLAREFYFICLLCHHFTLSTVFSSISTSVTFMLPTLSLSALSLSLSLPKSKESPKQKASMSSTLTILDVTLDQEQYKIII